METWGRIAHRRWAKTSEAALDYGDPQGTPRLRRAIAGYLRTARGVDAAPEQVLVLSSAQQALDLVARVLLDPGDALWMEDPGYPGARGAFVASGARLVPIPVDEEGLDVAKGEQLAPKARLAYVTPSHQFPLGATMSLPRRLRLLEWAHRAKAWIVEDDYDSEFRYVDRPLAALQGLDTHGRVLYAGTFSKVLFPSLRLAYLVLPPSLVGAFRAARYFSDGQPPAASQAVVTAFIEEGHFERHIRRMRVLCAERQKALVTTCARHLAGLLHVAPADGGMNLVGWLPEGSDDRAAAEAAARNEVEVIPLSALSRRRTKRPGLFLGYSAFRPREIEEGALRLRDALLSLRRHATG
jgi:GntR family transcriptional regulator/MocR family aminotransferase